MGGGGGRGAHCVKQRVLITSLRFLAREYCMLFAYKKRPYKGDDGHPRTPQAILAMLYQLSYEAIHVGSW